MANELKNILLAGIGSAAYTYEKAAKAVDDMVQRGKLTVEEGKELSEELKRTVKEKAHNENESKSLTKEDMAALLKEMNFATKEDINDLKTRIAILEEKTK